MGFQWFQYLCYHKKGSSKGHHNLHLVQVLSRHCDHVKAFVAFTFLFNSTYAIFFSLPLHYRKTYVTNNVIWPWRLWPFLHKLEGCHLKYWKCRHATWPHVYVTISQICFHNNLESLSRIVKFFIVLVWYSCK